MSLLQILLFTNKQKDFKFCPVDLIIMISEIDRLYPKLKKYGLTNTITKKILNLDLSEHDKMIIASNLNEMEWNIRTLNGVTLNINIDMKSMSIDDIKCICSIHMKKENILDKCRLIWSGKIINDLLYYTNNWRFTHSQYFIYPN